MLHTHCIHIYLYTKNNCVQKLLSFSFSPTLSVAECFAPVSFQFGCKRAIVLLCFIYLTVLVMRCRRSCAKKFAKRNVRVRFIWSCFLVVFRVHTIPSPVYSPNTQRQNKPKPNQTIPNQALKTHGTIRIINTGCSTNHTHSESMA